ncbi:MAG TPA: hypothetical protein VGF13_20650 [Verrucomicrobiae bacterium]|jgi:hypothetical protein
MNTKQWLWTVSTIVVGGLIVLTIAGLAGKKYYDSEVADSPLGALGGLFKR